MDRIRSSAEAPAVLAGSLAAFPLLDVLALLASTRHVGELKMVSEGTDDHFWLDGGDLIDTAGGATGRLFDLACAEDAWFTVTATTGVPAAGARMALATVVEHLAPRLAEWQALCSSVPFHATARMATSTTLPEVHVRADQWRILSMLGAGREVGEIVDLAGGPALETLRILHELAEAGLVHLEGAPRARPSRHSAAPSGGRNGATPAEQGRTGGAAGQLGGAAVGRQPTPTSLMPPPLATRPWAGSRPGHSS